jgi:hypothetical protein
MTVGALAAALFWTAAFARLPASTQRSDRRPMCVALFLFAIALTLNIPEIYVRFDRLVGVANLADLGEHTIGMIAVAVLLYALRDLLPAGTVRQGHPRILMLLPAVAVVSSVALFFAADVSQEAPNFTDRYGHLPTIAAYWTITIAYFGLVLFDLASAVRTHRKRTPRRALRLGLTFVGFGVWIGVAYSALKIIELAMSGVSRHPVVRVVKSIDPIALSAGGILLGAGLLLPALESTWTSAAKHLSDRLALLRLRALWRDLTSTMPGVVLGQRPSIWADVLGADASLRLYRRIIEVHDVLLALETAGFPLPRDLPRGQAVMGGGLHSPTDVRADLDALLELARVWPPTSSPRPAAAIA